MRTRGRGRAPHTGTVWTVAFCGFAPGLRLPPRAGDPLDRRAPQPPRTRVPAGSVALAGRTAASTRRTSPGGWQLIGRTDAVLWDLTRGPPALLGPGTRVHFRAVG